MSKVTDKEVLGDWSNLKGTCYHLVYAVWLLFCRQAADVRFYAGNDLTASPTVPPPAVTPDDVLAAAATSWTADTDVWIQLKATRTPWTVSALLDENLPYNFVCNARRSGRAGRSWQVRLVTEAEVRGEDVREFVSNPVAKRDNNAKLQAIVKRAHTDLVSKGDGLSESDVEMLAKDILLVLAATESVHLATLKAEVEAELALAVPDRASVRRIAGTLIGALVLDGGAGPAAARRYDTSWVNEEAGTTVVSDQLFDVDVAAACDRAITDRTTLSVLPARGGG